jgi:hypothetical protein
VAAPATLGFITHSVRRHSPYRNQHRAFDPVIGKGQREQAAVAGLGHSRILSRQNVREYRK